MRSLSIPRSSCLLILLFTPLASAAGGADAAAGLTVSITLAQPVVAAPFPARVTLHLHNAGSTAVWLYRHVNPPGLNDGGSAAGGSVLTVELEPVLAGTPPVASPIAPADGRTLSSVGLPHPRLVRLAPGADYAETAVVALSAARYVTDKREEPLWGDYHLRARYGAHFSNAAEIERDLGLTMWQGEVESDVVPIKLAPPPPMAKGAITGVVTRPDGTLLNGMLVSLTDRAEHLVGQTRSSGAGRFSFDRLPLDFYWVTARRLGSHEDSTTFQHAELSAATPEDDVKLVELPHEDYDSKQMLHKPVLVRVRRSDGSPAAGVALKIVWSNGTAIENLTAETSDDGAVQLELVPGRSYVTLKARGCPKQDTRIDVAEGAGIDDAALTLDCARK